jgi:anhydro-N-acetylmuramic acid kinase
MRIAGIMSGTSLDGIDVAIVDVRGREQIRVPAFETTPYPRRVREALLAVSNADTHTAQIARLNFLLGELFAEAVKRTCEHAQIPLDSVDLIGSHGQTIFHEGTPAKFLRFEIASTLQIGEPAVIAERTGIPVVSDFRPRDMAAGGMGAPLVPFVDYLLFHHARTNRVALNIGGIANLTTVPAGATTRRVIAFDTGPGNMVIDALVAKHTEGQQAFDRDGRIARTGAVEDKLLHELSHDHYYWAKPPKSAGREQYGAAFVERLLAGGHALPDLIATATALTTAAIAFGIDRFVRPNMDVDELIVSGGGAHNPEIMGQLAALLPGVAVCTSSDYGIDVDAKEAVAFALLAYETWRQRPSNLPSATGAAHPVILGKITPGSRRRSGRVR